METVTPGGQGQEELGSIGDRKGCVRESGRDGAAVGSQKGRADEGFIFARSPVAWMRQQGEWESDQEQRSYCPPHMVSTES